MTRLFVERVAPGRLELVGDDHHYLTRVLRVAPGDEVVLFDGQGGEARARVETIGASALTLAVGAVSATPPPRLPATLYLSLLKGEKMDLVVQKATELGVARIVPLRAERSVVRIDDERAGARLARWQKIAREAARQCGRADAPEVAPPATPAEAFRAAAGFRVLLHERAGVPLRELLAAAQPGPAALAIGPEGGFAPAEVEAAAAAGFHIARLGPRVLRAETAALAALAVIGFSVGDLA